MNLRDIATTLTNLFSAAAGPETQVATSILSPSINVLAKAIATHGVSVVIDAAEAAAAAAVAAKASGASGSDAGKAALNAAENSAIGVFVQLGEDVLHTLSTAAVTHAKNTAIVPTVPPAP